MRVQCPHCQKTVSLADASAEQPVACPSCGHIFTAPSLMMALPDEPTPAPPTAATVVAPPAVTPKPVTPSSESKPTPPAESPAPKVPVVVHRLTISRRVVHWFGPIALIVLFLLSFFSWVVASPGGYTIYSQSAWRLITGGFDVDPVGDVIFGRAAELSAQSSFSFLMLVTLLTLTFSVFIALGHLFEQYITVWIPDVIQKLWPMRRQFLLIVSVLIFVFISVMLIGGMGLESAVPAMAEAALPVPTTGPSADGEQRLKYERDLKRSADIARLGVRRTLAFCLAYTASGIAVAGFALELMLIRRGKRPEPVIELRY